MTRAWVRSCARGAAALLAVAFVFVVTLWPDAAVTPAAAQSLGIAALRARIAILDLEFGEADSLLEGAGDQAEIVIERARLALYRGDCDGAVALLDRSDLREHDGAADLEPVAIGCARAMAASVTRKDPRGVVVRFQDAADVALFPVLVDTALLVREMLARELGSRLPDPIVIDLVRDQLSLAALSGLPEKAAKTTGTVAVAKWGRVLLLSPRATPHGYGWLDTLAHEMTHLVLSKATRDRAPLWLQEGVAKRQELRWRARHPFDGVPSSDDIAATGIERGLGLPLTGLGPSIAMLPSAEQAMVAFAQVSSFVAYWVAESGEAALPKLLVEMRDAHAGADAAEAIKTVSGSSLDDWDTRWRSWLKAKPHAAPEEMMGGHELPSGSVVSFREVAKKRRLAELLLARGHAKASALESKWALGLLPTDAGARCVHADARLLEGQREAAVKVVVSAGDVRAPTARWWSLHAFYGDKDALPNARSLAIGYDPYDAHVSCEELPEGQFPADAIRLELCVAARRRPWR